MKKIGYMKKLKRNRERDERGFSLVELIIVIAIMAILVGIVGMQVLPYLNRSRLAKDQQVLDAYSTAAVSAYSMNAEDIDTDTTLDLYIDGTETADDSSTATEKLIADINEFAGYDRISLIDWSSTEGQKIKYMHIVYDWDKGIVTVTGSETGTDGGDVGIQGVDSIGVTG